MSKPITKEMAAEQLVSQLINRAYLGAIRSVTDDLERGPPGRKPKKQLQELHGWYANQSSEDQQYVKDIIREAVDATVFGCLVVLDGLTGGYPIPEAWSELALYLRYHEVDHNHEQSMEPQEIRFNGPKSGIDLHDVFRTVLQDQD